MHTVQLGKIKVIPGDGGGRFPFCNTLFIDDEVKVIVDPGAGLAKLTDIRQNTPVDLVLNTHYHFDHIVYNYIFDKSRIYINETEINCFRNREEIARRLGMIEVYGSQWTKGWLNRISHRDSPQSSYSPQNRHEWWLSTARVDGAYKWGEIFDFGGTKMEVIGAPGHTAGFSCLYFPDLGVVYTGDIDITDFGPWYCGMDGDIDLFVKSAQQIAGLDADTFITSHEAGILSRKEFTCRLAAYLEKINDRERKIAAALTKPLSLKEITGLGLIYGKKYLVDEWLWAWEELVVDKHLKKLLDRGLITRTGDKYVRLK